MMSSKGATLSAASNFRCASALPTLFGYRDQNSGNPVGTEPPLGGEGVWDRWGLGDGGVGEEPSGEERVSGVSAGIRSCPWMSMDVRWTFLDMRLRSASRARRSAALASASSAFASASVFAAFTAAASCSAEQPAASMASMTADGRLTCDPPPSHGAPRQRQPGHGANRGTSWPPETGYRHWCR